MKYEINRTKSKSGKRTMFFATIEGKRFSSTNYARKWEAERFIKSIIENNSNDTILNYINK